MRAEAEIICHGLNMSLAYNDDFKYFSNLSLINSIFSFKKSKRIEKCDFQQIFDDVQVIMDKDQGYSSDDEGR